MSETSIRWPRFSPAAGMKPEEWPVACIGPGRVGATLTRALVARGFPLAGIGGIPDADVERLAGEFGAAVLGTDYTGLGTRARLIVVTVPDDSLAEVFGELLQTAALEPENCLLQTSATVPACPLPASDRSGGEEPLFLSLHPMKPVPSADLGPDHFTEVSFGVEGGERARSLGCELARLLGGQPVELSARDKPAYHAAGVLGFTGLAALLEAVTELARTIGLGEEWVARAIAPGMTAMLPDGSEPGRAPLLTGPVSRGDTAVILAHLEALEESAPHLVPLYREVTQVNMRRAEADGLMDCDTLCALRQLLETF